MNQTAKISVVVITYNQQDCITKTLDTLTSQKDWIYEVIISDDCSKDNTWQVINNYAKNYPGFIKPFQNEKNLGIYGNMLAGYKRANGNVLATLSGDDFFMPGCCEKACRFLENQNVLDKVFHLYMDRRRHFADRRPDYTFKNNLAATPRRMSYALRQFICEPTFFSPKILERCTPVNNLGLASDVYWCLERMYCSDVVLYLNETSIQYNAGIGVSVTAPKIQLRKSGELTWNKILFENEMNFGKKDLEYAKYRLLLLDSYTSPEYKYLFLTTKAWVKSIDITLGLKNTGLFSHLKYLIRYLILIRKSRQR